MRHISPVPGDRIGSQNVVLGRFAKEQHEWGPIPIQLSFQVQCLRQQKLRTWMLDFVV
jgi:hypothetical protein